MLRGLNELASTPPPLDLLTGVKGQFDVDGWRDIKLDPEPFLQLGLCSERWLAHAIDALAEGARASPLDGDALLHGDVRSDNLCLRDGRVLFIDWNLACVGNPRLDLASWLPSLHAEGGPPPEQILFGDDAAPFASLLAGHFCSRAGLPAIPEAPHVRPLQRMQAETALPWAARELGLAPPA